MNSGGTKPRYIGIKMSISWRVVWNVKTADEHAHTPGMIIGQSLATSFWTCRSSGRGREEASSGPIADFFRFVASPSGDDLIGLLRVGDSDRVQGCAGGIWQAGEANQGVGQQCATPSCVECEPGVRAVEVYECVQPVSLPQSLASLMPSTARCLGPTEIVLEFEKSLRWPDDIRVIQKTKLTSALIVRATT